MSIPMLLPEPVSVEVREGQFVLAPDTVIVAEGAARDVAALCHSWVSPATGLDLPIVPIVPDDTRPALVFQLDAALSGLGAEGYTLAATSRRVWMRAMHPSGLFYALQTLRQLLPPEIFRSELVRGVNWTMPCVEISDSPRFGWRGAMLDSARHFLPKDFVLRFIDLLALHKLNTFHWHLCDDQGWRLEIKAYPRLTEVGAWREETLVGRLRDERAMVFDGTPHGGYFTQDDVREIVAYAQSQHVTVVPEIEMPGHAQAAIAAYPELGNTGDPVAVRTYWGISEIVYNVAESTFGFLQTVLDEVLSLFPGSFIHIGGDEVPKAQWQASPAAQARMRELGLRDEDELQSYFIRRMDAFLTSRGRRLIGWDEILEGGLAENAAVMSWRGVAGGVAAATAGHDVVMAPVTHTYLDHYQSEDRDREPVAIGGYLPLETVYAFDPHCPELSEAAFRHILGAQAQLWTEHIPTPEHAETMLFPRLCAFSEVVWTPPERKDYTQFLARLHQHLRRLDELGVNYRGRR
ncbi:MAG: beta-N-acetylhexosaminidase [Anaerolineae bacterium]|nr:beta-N-acetylhexosaminidase [Anaerolineae bacterium]